MRKKYKMQKSPVTQGLPRDRRGAISNGNSNCFGRSLNLKNIFNFTKPKKDCDNKKISTWRESGFVKQSELQPQERVKKAAFTLAEIIVVVVVLGIIAILTIPEIINNNKELATKTKIKKTIETYEALIRKMTIENRLKTTADLNAWAAGPNNNCDNAKAYFNIAKLTDNSCIFKTSDGIWWSIQDITRPLISLKEINEQNLEQIIINANSVDNKTAFVLVGRFGTDGSLRINDLAYEKNNSIMDQNYYESKVQVEKLYNFLANNIRQSEFMKNCVIDENDSNRCTLTYSCPTEENSIRTCMQIYTKIGITSESVECDDFCDWNPVNKICTPKSISKSVEDKSIWAADLSDISNWAYQDASSPEICAESRYKNCSTKGDYWVLAKKNCEAQGMRLPNSAELKRLYSAGKLQSSSYYWTAEASAEYTSRAYIFRTFKSGNVDDAFVYMYTEQYKLACVGK